MAEVRPAPHGSIFPSAWRAASRTAGESSFSAAWSAFGRPLRDRPQALERPRGVDADLGALVLQGAGDRLDGLGGVLADHAQRDDAEDAQLLVLVLQDADEAGDGRLADAQAAPRWRPRGWTRVFPFIRASSGSTADFASAPISPSPCAAARRTAASLSASRPASGLTAAGSPISPSAPAAAALTVASSSPSAFRAA